MMTTGVCSSKPWISSTKAGRILSRKIGRAGSIKRDPSTLLAEVPRSAPHDEKQVLKWFLSKERLMGVSQQAEFSAAKMSKVLLWVEAHMH
jgi:hypothetical protein